MPKQPNVRDERKGKNKVLECSTQKVLLPLRLPGASSASGTLAWYRFQGRRALPAAFIQAYKLTRLLGNDDIHSFIHSCHVSSILSYPLMYNRLRTSTAREVAAVKQRTDVAGRQG